KRKQEDPYKCKEINSDVIACKLLTFSVDRKYIDRMMKEVGTHKKMIFDLRGNRGGYVSTEEYLTGYFFDRDVKIADFIMRDKTTERFAKSKKEDSYKGDLFVLVDSNSASAAEVFARVMQLQKRGKIVGDVSAGAVMTSIGMSMANQRGVTSMATFSFFGLSVTIGDLIMSDGNRLENVGVAPDHPVGPTGLALFTKQDPVLAFAAALAGANLSPEDAGTYYFLTKKTEDDGDDESDGDN
ncbi:MAG: S41 family peptidase, partial [Acidobacteriota bacterium]